MGEYADLKRNARLMADQAVALGAKDQTSFIDRAGQAIRVATQSRFWRTCVDVYPLLVAAALPWSTTAVIVFWIMWVITLAPTVDPVAFLNTLRRHGSVLPLAFFGLAMVGMIWADGTWMERFQGLGPVAKLLIIPLLLYHFERSERAHWVFVAFAISCTLLLAYSFVIFAFPALQFTKAHGFDTTGVPIRNAIDQNQELALCGFGLAAIAVGAYRRRKIVISTATGVLAMLFFANILFVALARTSLIYLGALAVLFVSWHFTRRRVLQTVLLLIAATALVWLSSPYLRGRVEHVMIEYREYRERNQMDFGSAGHRPRHRLDQDTVQRGRGRERRGLGR
jgi:hypothetical protein